MADLDRVVRLIQSKRPELSEEEIVALMDKRKDRSSNMLSDVGAAELVVHDILMELEAKESKAVALSSLGPGLNDVNVGARVVAQWPKQTFERSSGGEGVLIRLLLADDTGTAPCVVWNANAERLERLGDLTSRFVKILHAYTRLSPTKVVELQCGDRSEVVVLEDAGPEGAYIFRKIAQLQEGSPSATVKGISRHPPKTIAFRRGDSEGKVVRITLADDTGSIDLVGWDEQANALQEIPPGSIIEVINGRLKKNAWGYLELHADKTSLVRVVGSWQGELASPPKVKIAELKPGTRISLAAKVLAVGKIREVKRRSGEAIQLRPLLIGDATGICELSLWNEQAVSAEKLSIGQTLLVEEALAKQRMGSVTVSLGTSGMIAVADVEDPGTPPFTRLAALSEGNLVNVAGTVVSKEEKRSVVTARGEAVEVTAIGVSDDTALVRLTFWREHAAEAEKLHVGAGLRVYGIRCRKGLDGALELASTPLTRIEAPPA